jgi:hypothetical protein
MIGQAAKAATEFYGQLLCSHGALIAAAMFCISKIDPNSGIGF